MPTIEEMNAWGQGKLPGMFGFAVTASEPGRLAAQLTIRPDMLAPNGYLHAATIVALADSACGYGSLANLPEGAQNFTTLELKTNFLGTARSGALTCDATLAHGGRTTHIWDAVVRDEAGKTLALFRCTQLILYPR